MNLVNLTPHILNIITPAGTIALPPSGGVARVNKSTALVEIPGVDVPLVTIAWGGLAGLPEPDGASLFIVSNLVREAVPRRQDVASPGELVRGPDGQPVGCQGLVVNPRA